jgi:hypothetical protein
MQQCVLCVSLASVLGLLNLHCLELLLCVCKHMRAVRPVSSALMCSKVHDAQRMDANLIYTQSLLMYCAAECTRSVRSCYIY